MNIKVWSWVWFLLLMCCAATSWAGNVGLKRWQLGVVDGGLQLNAHLAFEVPLAVEEVLRKGIPLVFVLDVSLVRQRWYWVDKKIISTNKSMRLAYQPLTRRWRLNIGSLPQYFSDLKSAIRQIQTINQWRIAEISDIDAGATYELQWHFQLDTSQLPRPFQIGLIGQSDWDVSLYTTMPWTYNTP